MGFEPMAKGLKVPCSTAELTPRNTFSYREPGDYVGGVGHLLAYVVTDAVPGCSWSKTDAASSMIDPERSFDSV